MNDYEAQREQLIARNRARLVELGLLAAADDLQTAAAVAAKAKKPKKSRKPREVREATRHSARTAGKAPEALGAEEAVLAQLLVDQLCPKCGKVVSVGQKKHLASCRGTGPPTAWHPSRLRDVDEGGSAEDDEDVPDVVSLGKASQAEQAKSDAKLKSLELSGLIEMTDDEAKFLVVGSTGSRYTVVLGGAKRSCQCMDHRLRRRDCKHIRLVLQQLGLEGDGVQGGWRQAVEKQTAAAAAAADIGSTGPGDTGGERGGVPLLSPTADARTASGAAAAETGGQSASGVGSCAGGGAHSRKRAAAAKQVGRGSKGPDQPQASGPDADGRDSRRVRRRLPQSFR